VRAVSPPRNVTRRGTPTPTHPPGGRFFFQEKLEETHQAVEDLSSRPLVISEQRLPARDAHEPAPHVAAGADSAGFTQAGFTLAETHQTVEGSSRRLPAPRVPRTWLSIQAELALSPPGVPVPPVDALAVSISTLLMNSRTPIEAY
jgi:hypothetical protein